MFHDNNRYIITAFVVVLAVVYVAARPPTYKEFVVTDVANKTMCPIKVEINEDPERVPRRIKYLRCAGRPNKMCSEHHAAHGCCKHHHHGYRAECVEIYDFVQVSYRQRGLTTIKVPVGCTCLLEETTVAAEVP